MTKSCYMRVAADARAEKVGPFGHVMALDPWHRHFTLAPARSTPSCAMAAGDDSQFARALVGEEAAVAATPIKGKGSRTAVQGAQKAPKTPAAELAAELAAEDHRSAQSSEEEEGDAEGGEGDLVDQDEEEGSEDEEESEEEEAGGVGERLQLRKKLHVSLQAEAAQGAQDEIDEPPSAEEAEEADEEEAEGSDWAPSGGEAVPSVDEEISRRSRRKRAKTSRSHAD